MIADDDDLLRRAFAAYFRNARVPSPDQPSDAASHLTDLGGKRYVVLQNGSRVLAVYRVRNDGMLKGMRRWPKGLEA